MNKMSVKVRSESMLRKRNNVPRPEPETDPQAEKKAVALQYNPSSSIAPRVIAKGRGYVAENIMAAAQKNSIPVYQNKSLVNLLMALEIDKEIPAELYKAVAEILAYVYRVDQKAKKKPELN